MACGNYRQLVAYKPPDFAVGLPNVPKQRIRLTMLPTPIHEWKLSEVPLNFKLYIKRDDLTGNLLSGNKIRKLEFLLAEAVAKGSKSIITCGTVKSNHCRATAVACKELGLDCHIIMKSHNPKQQSTENPGNLLPPIFSGCRLYFVPWDSEFDKDIYVRQEKLSKQIEMNTGIEPYYIPLGGSCGVGLFGYIEAWREMLDQGISDTVDDIFVACGSAGTLSGLSIANYLTGQKIKIHAINIKKDEIYPKQHVDNDLDQFNITKVRADDIIDFIHGHAGEGHCKSTNDEHHFVQKIAKDTGIFCDQNYTGKVVNGMLYEMRMNPSRFQGNRVLFIHTGGTIGIFDGTFQSCLDKTLLDVAYTWENPQHEPIPFGENK